MSYGYYYEEEAAPETTVYAEEEVEAQPISFVLQPLASLLGIGYGTWTYLEYYEQEITDAITG